MHGKIGEIPSSDCGKVLCRTLLLDWECFPLDESGETMICGLKLTHDGCLAVIAEDELLFSTEAEKVDNRPRYSVLNSAADLSAVLATNGLHPNDITAIAVDGWFRN